MTGDRVTFTLSPKSPYVDCSWMDGPQVGRKTIEFSAFVKAIQESAPAPTACSGLLPPGTISYCESPNHQITMTVESSDEYADITYFNTRYEHFPLPHLIFQFSFLRDSGCSRCGSASPNEEGSARSHGCFIIHSQTFVLRTAGFALAATYCPRSHLSTV